MTYKTQLRTTEDFRAYVEMHKRLEGLKSWNEALCDLASKGGLVTYGFAPDSSLQWGGKRQGQGRPKSSNVKEIDNGENETK